jgi:YegS/Rv2252/BmrU family lipid kinase
MRQAYLVYNPVSGRFPSYLLAERAARVLEKNGWSVRLEQTRDGPHITELARQAASEGMDAFFVAGGDGSVNLALPGLLHSNTALAVLPSGTANVWAQELGLPGLTWTRWLALEESAARVANGQVRQVDVGICSGRPFLLWSGVGLDAFIVHRIEPRARLEKHFAVVSYTASAVISASAWRGVPLQVVADGQEISGHFLLALVSNIHLYAGGLAALTPNALLDDGVMDFWMFKGENLADTVQMMYDMLAGRHLYSEQVIHLPFRSLELRSESKLYVQVDGEPMEGEGPVQISVQNRALRVLAPLETPLPLFSDAAGSMGGQA